MSTGFVTETEAAELRKKRQEEWEKVRNPEDPQGNFLLFISWIINSAHCFDLVRRKTRRTLRWEIPLRPFEREQRQEGHGTRRKS